MFLIQTAIKAAYVDGERDAACARKIMACLKFREEDSV